MSEKVTPDGVEARSLIVPICNLFTRINETNKGNRWVDVWARVLEVQVSDRGLYAILDLISRAIDRAIHQLEYASDIPDFSKSTAIGILKACSVYLSPSELSNAPNEGRQHFSPDKIVALRMAADFLNRRFLEPKFSGDQIEELKKLLNEIEEVLKAGSLPSPIVTLMLAHVHTMRWALIHFDLVGVDGLMRACMDAGLELRRMESSDETDAAEKKIGDAFGRIVEVVNTADKMVRIGEAGYKLGNWGEKLLESVLK